MENVRSRIRKIREQRNLTLKEVAEAIKFDVSNLSKIENGKREVTIHLVEKLAEYYNLPISYFFGEEIEVPKELDDIGVEWITFAEEMKKENLTPDEIINIIKVVKSLSKN
jgi:transcriptional regulator with XRE-family HTH domain